MLTIVTLNWARPACTKHNLEAYAAYAGVDQVICFNNGPRLEFTPRLPKRCLLVEASANVGVTARMAMGALAATPAILHVDDDLLLPESTIYRLLNCWQSAPMSCHGIFGRRAHPRYTPGNVFGPSGEGHVRCSYATALPLLEEALERIGRFLAACG